MQDVFIIAIGLIAALSGTSAAISLARRIGALDQPADNKIHRAPTPRIGGLGIAAGLVAGICFASVSHLPGYAEAIWIMAAALAALLVGLVDDIVTLSAPKKLIGICAAAAVPFAGGLGPSGIAGALFAWLFVALMANAVNLLDGMDGLAGSVVLAAAVAFWATSYASAGPVHPISIALIGALFGFLWFNLPPATRTFMGDSGSLLLGCVLGWMAISLGSSSPRALSSAVLISAIPIADTLFVMCRRLLLGRPLTIGGLDHTYNLIACRAGQRTTLLAFVATSLLLGALGVMISECSCWKG